MHVKPLIYGAAAAGAVALAAVGLSAGAANAAAARPTATNACGSNCVNASFQEPGFKEVLKSWEGLNNTNNVISLRPESNSLPAEDFTAIDAGTIDGIYCNGTGQAQNGSLFTNNQCHALDQLGYGADQTWQAAFNPNNGGPETECIGAWDSQFPIPSGYKMRLVPCGVNADTVFILADNLPGGHSGPGIWLVGGGSNNYSNPLVATVGNTDAYQVARWITVQFNGSHGIGTQEAYLRFGALP